MSSEEATNFFLNYHFVDILPYWGSTYDKVLGKLHTLFNPQKSYEIDTIFLVLKSRNWDANG